MPSASMASTSVLAIDGGKPVWTRPFAPWPHFAADELEAAAGVLRSGKVNYWTGEEGRAFEREFAAFTSAGYAVALANGTVALELALQVCGVGAGDDVVVPARTFIASASCAVMLGARPVVADVDRESGCLTAETVRAVLTPQTKAIIAVHLAGWPCEMDPLLALARERDLVVIEDCAQAVGARYQGKPVGSLGDVAAFSFCQDKIITTAGEGGMLVTNDEARWSQAWSFKDHGKSFDAVYKRDHAPGFRWLHESFGTNWRMTEMQAAVGRAQLCNVADWVAKRREYAAQLDLAFAALPALRVVRPDAGSEHSYYKYYVYLRPEALRDGWTRDRIMAAINAEGVPCFEGSCSEIYREGAFPAAWRPTSTLLNARELGATALMFLVHPTLSDDEIGAAIVAVRKVLGQSSR